MANLSRESFRYRFKISDWNPTKSSLVRAFRCIQSEERERIQRFQFKDDFKPALIGRLLIRSILNQRFGLANKAIELKREPRGRPYLAIEESTDDQIFNQGNDRPKTFDFNVSHHGDYCVAVAENVKRIGVDVMKIERRFGNRNIDDYFRLMNDKFTENEWRHINGNRADDDERMRRYMRMWTLKESFAKADGRGLTIDLRKIDFTCKTERLEKDRVASDTLLKFEGQLLTDWTFLEYLLDDTHCVAIAINRPPNEYSNREQLNEIKIDQLLENLEPLDESVDADSLWSSYDAKSSKGA